MALRAAVSVEEVKGLREEEDKGAKELESSMARRLQRHIGQNPVKCSFGDCRRWKVGAATMGEEGRVFSFDSLCKQIGHCVGPQKMILKTLFYLKGAEMEDLMLPLNPI